YSEGWKAVVDGEEVPIKRANTAFMALELGAGSHDIKLTYMTPGLLQGIALSAAGLVAFAGVAALCETRRRRNKTTAKALAEPSTEKGSPRNA
ncbi:MAG: YfhO family protein, partial [Gordonibacter sp.]|uniref:YfhO family protein n=1 Tax=Gordonibacter sp. TaxID=1968902 RepID=UPI002FC652D6